MVWALLFFSVIRVQVDSFEVRIPERNRFELAMEVTVQETTWQDTTAFFYRYTLINLPVSEQPVGGLFFYYFPLEVFNPEEYRLRSVNTPVESLWVEKNGNVKVEDPASIGVSFPGVFSPGDTAHLYILSYRFLPDLTYWWAYGEDSLAVVEIRGGESEDRAIWIADSVTEALGIFKQTPFGPGKYGRTVGPGPLPPQSLDSMVIHLQIRKDTALAIGWMDEHAHNRLGRLLDQALRWAQEENRSHLRSSLERFLSTLERLHNQGHVQDEAFYVLYYRARYILNRLPFPEGPPGR